MVWHALVIILVVFHLAFLFGQLLKNNSIVDPLWGIGFVIVAWYGLAQAQVVSLTHFVVTLLVSVWGIRLATHIFHRNLGKGEDWRYKEWREQWGNRALLIAYGKVYLTQGLLMWVIAQPIIYVNSHDVSTLGFYTLSAGLIVWLVGFFFESVGDKQLRQYIKQKPPKDKILRTGLWRYTRHPNYFGEATMWWGIWIIAMGSLPFAWWLVISPLTITFLLTKVSGVPLLEKKMMKDPAYRAYARKTSKFFPRKPA